MVIDTISKKATREVELRLSPILAARMYPKVEMRVFMSPETSVIDEVGCSWWTGADTNVVAKVRKRTKGESVVKVPLATCRIAPGCTLAISDEYGFMGRITHPQYKVSIREVRCTIDIGTIKLLVNSRMYGEGETATFAGEFEFVGVPTTLDVSRVLSVAINVIGPVDRMVKEIDVVFAEVLVDWTLVHIDTLAVNGTTKVPPGSRRNVSMIMGMRPEMVFRTFTNRIPTPKEVRLMDLPSDGVVQVTDLRMMRMKTPTVDLVYADENMSVIKDGALMAITTGGEAMNEGSVYEMDVVKGDDEGMVILVRPRLRVNKRVPNHMDVVWCAFVSVWSDPFMTSSLFGITSMSISMRTRVYEMARARAPAGRKVIVVFGAGRLQEWRQMLTANFSYVVVDPEIDVTILSVWTAQG